MKRFAPLLAGAALAAHGEEQPLWELGAGVVALNFPDYRGSGKQRTYLLPVPVFAYRGEVYQADRERLRGLLFRSDRVEMDLSVTGSVPARSGDNSVREGMPDLDPTLELGPSLNIRLAHSERRTLRLRLPLRAQLASDFHSIRDTGVVANPNLNLDVRLDEGWRMGFVAGALFANRRNHDYFYSVAPEFARPGRPAYQAPGGYSGAQLLVALSRHFGAWFVGGFVKHDFLQGAAFEASPLVERRNNVSAGIAFTRKFAQSEKRVVVRD
jgi:outer membrane scaffolding protein for murein synthesis (MipA/OmpV family)